MTLVSRMSNYHHQHGVALVVSLVLLIVITLLSVTAMRSANIDTKIAVNHQHKQMAFQAAENALTKLLISKPSDVSPPEAKGATIDKGDWYYSADPKSGVDSTDPSWFTKSSADLKLELIEISKPGQYKFSGYGLNIITIVFQADAIGEVDGTNAKAHNRMEVALVRE